MGDLLRSIPACGPLYTGRKERRFDLVMGDRRRLALRAKLIEGYPWSREERQHLLGRIGPDSVRELALFSLTLLRCCDRRHPCGIQKIDPPRYRRVLQFREWVRSE